MDSKDFQASTAGVPIKTDSGYWAFLPAPLPPVIDWSPRLISTLSEADRALARLDEIGKNFLNAHILAKPFVRREAVLSSRIEGTRASLLDLYNFEATQFSFLPPGSDVREVHNYVRALDYGLERLPNLPVSQRLIREIHKLLMEDVRGEHWTPGEFRRSQNWIGPPGSTINSATYVPPPVEEMYTTLNQLEIFIHSPSDLPVLIRIGLIHYQFEAIHPFLDGNGRVGRLLIILLLCEWGLLSQPILYPSEYFDIHRPEYYQRLLFVSQRGDWEGWLQFFLTGLYDGAADASQHVQRLQSLRLRYKNMISNERTADQLMMVIDYLFGQPVTSIRQIQAGVNLSDHKTAKRYIDKLTGYGIVREITGRVRNKVYKAEEILRAIESSSDH